MPTDQTPTAPRERELNLDPLTGEPGSHPVGTGVGAAAAGAAGAAIGAIAGPVGMAVGAVIGAVAGGYAGKGTAEAIDPTAEDAYSRENHRSQSYAREGSTYKDYAPAYRAGYAGYREGQTFDEREADLSMEYEGGPQKADAEADAATVPGTMQNSMSTYPLRWENAREAARAAYDRAGRSAAKPAMRAD